MPTTPRDEVLRMIRRRQRSRVEAPPVKVTGDMTVAELIDYGVQPKTSNSFEEAGVVLVSELLALDVTDLVIVPNLGVAGIRQVLSALAKVKTKAPWNVRQIRRALRKYAESGELQKRKVNPSTLLRARRRRQRKAAAKARAEANGAKQKGYTHQAPQSELPERDFPSKPVPLSPESKSTSRKVVKKKPTAKRSPSAKSVKRKKPPRRS